MEYVVTVIIFLVMWVNMNAQDKRIAILQKHLDENSSNILDIYRKMNDLSKRLRE